MLQTVALDGVIVASPPFCHLEHVQAAARAGVPVLCEKPLARTVAEAQAMLAACRQAGTLLMVAFNRRFLSPLWTATQMIGGELGEVFATECIWTSWTLASAGWRDAADCLGGVFQDHGSHSIDLALQWLGSPVASVFAHAQRLGQRAVEDHLSAMVTHANGRTSLHVHSRASHRPVSEFYRIYGTRGTLELEYTGDWSYLAPDSWRLELYRDGQPRPQRLVARRPGHELLGVLPDGAYGYYVELKLFADAIRAGSLAATPAGEEGLAVVQAVSAAFLSAAQRRVVPVGEAEQFNEQVFQQLRGTGTPLVTT
jgi:predicted dehydrogenase